MHPIEKALIQAFIAPSRRSSWLRFLGSPKRRRRFLDRLNHGTDLDPRYVQLLPSNTDVVGILRLYGAPALCHVVSDLANIDGREMALKEAVWEAELGGFGTLISCIPGRLGYFYDENGTRRALLIRQIEPAIE